MTHNYIYIYIYIYINIYINNLAMPDPFKYIYIYIYIYNRVSSWYNKHVVFQLLMLYISNNIERESGSFIN